MKADYVCAVCIDKYRQKWRKEKNIGTKDWKLVVI